MTRLVVPAQTLERLPLYVRALDDLAGRGMTTVSSAQLSQETGVPSAQIRRDLSRLGSYGTRGLGYDVAQLTVHVRDALGVSQRRGVVIVGVGHLGRAIARYAGLDSRGFDVVALVDVDEALVGQEVSGLRISQPRDLPQIVERLGVRMAVLATPPAAAQASVDALAAAGIESILSFAPRQLLVPDGVALRTVDVAAELQILSFYMAPSTAQEFQRDVDGNQQDQAAEPA